MRKGRISRKGQVTVFIILGLVIFSTAALFFYIRSRSVPTRDLQPTFEDVPVEFQPVKQYVDSCLYEISREAIVKIGLHGGYIDPGAQGMLFNKEAPTESDGIDFLGGIPYWWYLKSPNTCTRTCQFASNKPNLYKYQGEPSVEGQVEQYVIDHMDRCLDGFSPLAAAGYTVEVLEQPTVETAVTDEGMAIKLRYPIEVVRETSKRKIQHYFVLHYVRLKQIWELSQNLTANQADEDYRYLEYFTQNLITAFSGTKANKLPSTSDIEFKAAGAVWIEHNVKQDVEAMLTTYVPALQVENSRNYYRPRFSNQLAQTIYDNMIIPSEKLIPAPNLKVMFDYLNWPIYFDLNCKNGICQPESAFSELIFFGIQRYNFAYDVSYPVMVTVEDPQAFSGEGYKFRFALESNTRNNEPLVSDFTPFQAMTEQEASQLCNPNQRNSGEISLKVTSRGEPLEAATVSYTFPSGESCLMGETDEDGELNERFPICEGCILSVSKLNYLGKSRLLSTGLDEAANLGTFRLEEITEKQVLVKAKNLNKELDNKWTFTDAPLELEPEDQAIITLERVGDSTDEEFSSITVIQGAIGSNTIRLAPGTYAAEIQVIRTGKLVIPKERRCVHKVAGICLKHMTIPEIVLEPTYPYAGAYLNEKSRYVTITQSQIDGPPLVFYAIGVNIEGIEPETRRKAEDLGELGKIEDYSAKYRQSIEPGTEQ